MTEELSVPAPQTKEMSPEAYNKVRCLNDAAIRRLQRETDTAESAAVKSPPPKRENLRPATIEDVRAGRVLWLDFDGHFEWRIPSDEPHPSARCCIDIDGESVEWLGAFVDEAGLNQPATSCECRDWARDGRDLLSPHHPRCQHYTPPPPDPRFAFFGEAMWNYITRQGGDFCGEEISEDILPQAQAAGLCHRVQYNPTLHGEGIEADPGASIWWWGNEELSGQNDQAARLEAKQ